MDRTQVNRQNNVLEPFPSATVAGMDTKLTSASECCDLYRNTLPESETDGADASTLTLREWLDRAEAWRIRQVLRECRGNRSAAARRLGIGRRTLYSKMDRLEIAPRTAKRNDVESSAPAA